jgi:hypothetical protein
MNSVYEFSFTQTTAMGIRYQALENRNNNLSWDKLPFFILPYYYLDLACLPDFSMCPSGL